MVRFKMAQNDSEPQLPVPISLIDNRYLLFDIKAITWLRKHHNICGVFIGSLPQNPSQNVFMGLPMEIMPEEAQLLIELGTGYILDDAQAHDVAMAKAHRSKRAQYVNEIEEQAIEISAAKAREKEADKKRAMKKTKAKRVREDTGSEVGSTNDHDQVQKATPPEDPDAAESLFAPPEEQDLSTSTQASTKNQAGKPPPSEVSITPATSAFLPLLNTETITPLSIPSLLPGLTASSYNLYRHLHLHPHQRTFFTTPGLRFGCQFCVYPGDPLRFHSHFLAVGVDWEEEIDLMDIVGGGRLGTGVKKGWLFGGKDPTPGRREGEMRTFSVEWAVM